MGETTKLANLIDPEVLAQYIDQKHAAERKTLHQLPLGRQRELFRHQQQRALPLFCTLTNLFDHGGKQTVRTRSQNTDGHFFSSLKKAPYS